MTQQHAYLPASFVDILIRYLDERHIAAPELRPTLVELAQVRHLDTVLFSQLMDQMHQLDPVPALGLRIGRLAQPQNFGLVGYLLTSCSTLGQALIRYGRFQTLVLTDLTTQVEVQGNAVSHQWLLRGTDNPLSYEFSAAIFINLYQSLISKTIAPIRVGLPFAKPADARIYEAILGCPVEFGTRTLRVDIPAHLTRMTISTSDPYLLRMLDQQAEALLHQEAQENESFEEFLRQLQQLLLIAMRDGDTRASTMAAKMNYSLRSFYRKLSEHGYSYRSVLADTRRRLAKRYLADPALTPADVALLLGYSEQSAFIRAFKDWMGMTPGDFRQSCKLESRQSPHR